MELMPGLRDGVDSVLGTASTVKTGVVEVVSTLVVIGLLAGWSLFWGMVVNIHYTHGDLTSAMFTTTVFVAPAVVGLVWYVGQLLDLEIPSTSIDANLLSS